MEERIQINGVWYVREDNQNKIESEEFDFIETEQILLHTSNSTFIAERYKNDEGEYGNPIVDYKSKISKDEDVIDNDLFLKGVLNGTSDSIRDLNDGTMNEEQIKEFMALLNKMNELKWFE